MKNITLNFIYKIITYSLVFGGLKVLKIDELIISLTNILNAIAQTIK